MHLTIGHPGAGSIQPIYVNTANVAIKNLEMNINTLRIKRHLSYVATWRTNTYMGNYKDNTNRKHKYKFM